MRLLRSSVLFSLAAVFSFAAANNRNNGRATDRGNTYAANELTANNGRGYNSQAQETEASSIDDDDSMSDAQVKRRCNRQDESLRIDCSNLDLTYRRIDGKCNNIKKSRSWWGGVGAPLLRVVNSTYPDNKGSIRRQPNPRAISFAMSSADSENDPFKRFLFVSFAQLIDHELVRTIETHLEEGEKIEEECACNGRNPLCINIEIPENDPVFQGIDCFNVLRSAKVVGRKCRKGARQQGNAITAFVDASFVYGSSEKELADLRDANNPHLLNVTDNNGQPLLPQEVNEACSIAVPGDLCFKAGDVRNSEQPGLTSLHTIFVLEHNRIARRLRRRHVPQNISAEITFQEARRILIAIVQHITYYEYLPLVVGNELYNDEELNIKPLDSGHRDIYDKKVNPSIINGFATAAYRYGHSLLPSELRVEKRTFHEFNEVHLGSRFFKPLNFYLLDGLRRVVNGITDQDAQRMDERVTPEVGQFLFTENRASDTLGLDLLSLNINRGRDHGIGSYNDYRKYLDEEKVESFDELPDGNNNDTADVIDKLKSLYKDKINRLDFIVGGMLEEPVEGGTVGITFAKLIAKQFSNLAVGDRYWYEDPNSFTVEQLNNIKNSSRMGRLICQNTNTRIMRPYPFVAARNDDNEHLFDQSFRSDDSEEDDWRPFSGNNDERPCNSFTDLNLDLFDTPAK